MSDIEPELIEEMRRIHTLFNIWLDDRESIAMCDYFRAMPEEYSSFRTLAWVASFLGAEVDGGNMENFFWFCYTLAANDLNGHLGLVLQLYYESRYIKKFW